jgi:hypothetical protein
MTPLGAAGEDRVVRAAAGNVHCAPRRRGAAAAAAPRSHRGVRARPRHTRTRTRRLAAPHASRGGSGAASRTFYCQPSPRPGARTRHTPSSTRYWPRPTGAVFRRQTPRNRCDHAVVSDDQVMADCVVQQRTVHHVSATRNPADRRPWLNTRWPTRSIGAATARAPEDSTSTPIVFGPRELATFTSCPAAASFRPGSCRYAPRLNADPDVSRGRVGRTRGPGSSAAGAFVASCYLTPSALLSVVTCSVVRHCAPPPSGEVYLPPSMDMMKLQVGNATWPGTKVSGGARPSRVSFLRV